MARNALFEGPFWPEKGENDKIFKNAPVGFFFTATKAVYFKYEDSSSKNLEAFRF